MSFTSNDLFDYSISYRSGTEGGGTYYLNKEPICLAHLYVDDGSDCYCSLKAGWGTDHLGLGRCKYHGGSTHRRNLLARYTRFTKAKLREQYEDFITDPDLLNLAPELATQRAMLADALDKYERHPDGLSEYGGAVRVLIRDIGNMVERIEKIQSTHVLTAATARYLIMQGLEVARRFIPEHSMPEFVMLWKQEVQGSLWTPKEAEKCRIELPTITIEQESVE